jgi:hypothetical protein
MRNQQGQILPNTAELQSTLLLGRQLNHPSLAQVLGLLMVDRSMVRMSGLQWEHQTEVLLVHRWMMPTLWILAARNLNQSLLDRRARWWSSLLVHLLA